MFTHTQFTVNSFKRIVATALCATALTLVTVTPSFATSGLGSDMQGND